MTHRHGRNINAHSTRGFSNGRRMILLFPVLFVKMAGRRRFEERFPFVNFPDCAAQAVDGGMFGSSEKCES
jgi:hypothetical protein